MKKRRNCRICNRRCLTKILDLGTTPLADSFVSDPETVEKRYPLQVAVCTNCWLVQLLHDVDSMKLFGNDYAFFTSASPSSIAHFQKYAEDVMLKYRGSIKNYVLEIASNDGILLKNFQKAGHSVLGIDPASTVANQANMDNVPTICDFFTAKNARRIRRKYGKPSIIMANNVVAHVEDLHDFMNGITELMAKDTVFVFEVQYFVNLLMKNQFDNVYHEHRSYFSVTPLAKLLSMHGLRIIDVEDNDAQGGSIRVHACRQEAPYRSTFIPMNMIRQEDHIGLYDERSYQSMQSRVAYTALTLHGYLKFLKSQGKRIAGYGASAKSNTLLNVCDIGPNELDFILDKTPYKIGKYTPGTHIPIKNLTEGQLVDEHIDYLLVLVWNYINGITEREKLYKFSGGKFIVPHPVPTVIDG